MNQRIRFIAFLFLAGLAACLAADPITVQSGARLAMNATSDGNPPPTFEWFLNGQPIGTGPQYVITSATPAHAGSYTAKATNNGGWAISSPQILIVEDRIAPAIATQPASMEPTEGTHVSLVVVATGTPAPAYQWRKNGVPLPGATNADIKFAPISRTDSGTYDVVVTNSMGSVTSQQAVVNVLYPPSAPVITTAFSSVTVYKGQTLTLALNATGDNLSWRWQKGTKILTGETRPYLTLYNVNTKDSAQYTATVSNPWGVRTASGRVTVLNQKPPATLQ